MFALFATRKLFFSYVGWEWNPFYSLLLPNIFVISLKAAVLPSIKKVLHKRKDWKLSIHKILKPLKIKHFKEK